jgi:hypothetical protein
MRYDLARNLPNVGTYTTLTGAFYLDFGTVPSLLLAALMGVGLRAGLQCIFDGATTTLAVTAPLVFVIMAAGPITTLLPNLWPCFVWIALMSATPLFMVGWRQR